MQYAIQYTNKERGQINGERKKINRIFYGIS